MKQFNKLKINIKKRLIKINKMMQLIIVHRKAFLQHQLPNLEDNQIFKLGLMVDNTLKIMLSIE